ncbi:MAG TPA: phosphate acetyltransferase [Tianweitania sediminis]|nr:phosphate acetyltransferase [Tianweitania sediminis]
MKPLVHLIEAAKAQPRHIVLSEGEDPRVVEAGVRAVREGIAEITLVGRADAVHRLIETGGGRSDMLHVEDPSTSPLTPRLADAYLALRRNKGVDADAAALALRSPLVFAAMMVREAFADGTVGGATNTTAETVRTALQTIGRAPGVELVSSFFLMLLCEPHHVKKGVLVFADCGLVVEPSAAELAAIAVMSANSYRDLTGNVPKVAMLSFSTAGSAAHPCVSKVTEATERARVAAPDLIIDGELQFDAAFVEAVSRSKAPSSVLHGDANVFVFPDLNAGNLGYKIAQRIGGAEAIGPILQGLAKPANDLSRGCSVSDIFHMIAVTSVQARS